MRYGSVPRSFPEWLAFKAGVVPIPILDTVLPAVQGRALIAAGRAGVLRALAEKPDSVADLAARLKLDAECLRLVLRVLESMRYVRRRGDQWSLTRMGKKYFGPQATESYEAFVDYGEAMWRYIDRLGDVLQSGKGIDFHEGQDTQEWTSYQRSMLENARSFAWFVTANTPVAPGARLCLDIAGSHGYVGAMLCEKHPGLRSVVLDRPEALATARELGRGLPWHEHVTFREGDLLRSDFAGEPDVVLLSNILHHFSAETNRAILRRVHQALKPGGAVSIFEIETPPEDAPVDAAGEGFALFFRVTSTSTCFRGEDYTSWLREAGFQNVRVLRSFRMPSRMLVVGRA